MSQQSISQLKLESVDFFEKQFDIIKKDFENNADASSKLSTSTLKIFQLEHKEEYKTKSLLTLVALFLTAVAKTDPLFDNIMNLYTVEAMFDNNSFRLIEDVRHAMDDFKKVLTLTTQFQTDIEALFYQKKNEIVNDLPKINDLCKNKYISYIVNYLNNMVTTNCFNNSGNFALMAIAIANKTGWQFSPNFYKALNIQKKS